MEFRVRIPRDLTASPHFSSMPEPGPHLRGDTWKYYDITALRWGEKITKFSSDKAARQTRRRNCLHPKPLVVRPGQRSELGGVKLRSSGGVAHRPLFLRYPVLAAFCSDVTGFRLTFCGSSGRGFPAWSCMHVGCPVIRHRPRLADISACP